MKSSDLSRYPPPMMIGLAEAISNDLVRKPVPQLTLVHRDPVSDRPSSLPLAHRVSLMDENLVVQLGFRTPLRDGGGKLSPGRLPPPLRKTSPLAQLGTKIQALHRRMWFLQANLSFSLSSPAWLGRQVTRTGNSPLHFERAFPWVWTRLLSHRQVFSQPRRN